MECKRCHHNYDPEATSAWVEEGKLRIKESGKDLYTENTDGLCEYCAMIVMCGYDRQEY